VSSPSAILIRGDKVFLAYASGVGNLNLWIQTLLASLNFDALNVFKLASSIGI